MDVIRNAVMILMIVSTAIVSGCEALAAGLLFVDTAGNETEQERQVQTASEFFGLEVRKLRIRTPADQQRISGILKSTRTVAVVLHARSLHLLSRERLSAQIAARDPAGGKPVVIIAGIREDTDPEALAAWSGGKIQAVVDAGPRTIAGSLVYSGMPEINGPFSEQRAGGVFAGVSYFRCPDAGLADIAAGIREEPGGRFLPVMITVGAGGTRIVFIADFRFVETMHDERGINYREVMNLLPLMAPVQSACGPYCWHGPGLFANLTIDDPFLVEPYGNLSYAGLLGEMRKNRFHTTIAFIPWNYDRSEQGAVELVRNNPEHYSVSIHGSDHDGDEFQATGETAKNQAKITRALARMKRFTQITGIPHDRVMIYPRDLGPAETAKLLKQYDFLGTANWRNIPSDVRVEEQEVIHSLREVVFDVGGIPSLKRYNPLAVSDFRVAMTIFSGMPLLYSCHQHDFEGGIDWFSRIAEKVNGFYPDMKWVRLSDVFRHLYLKKKRDDGGWEIRAYSRNIRIDNLEQLQTTYHVVKPDDFSIPVRRVSVNGTEQAHTVAGQALTFSVALPPNGSADILIEYENEHALQDVDVSRQGVYQWTIRWLSDFRDRELSTSGGGRLLVRVIYSNRETKTWLAFVAAVLCGLIAVCSWIKRGGASR